MKTFIRLFRANLKNLLRDHMSTFWFLAFPVLFILLFGLIFSRNEEASYTIGMAFPKGDPLAEGVVQGFKSVKAFKIVEGTLKEELDALKKGDRGVVVEIPEGASTAAAMGQEVEIPVYYDQGKLQTGQMLYSAVSQVLNEAERVMSGRPRILVSKLESIQTNALKNIDYLLPGILAMALMQLGLFGALQLVSLREQKVLKGLGATPLQRPMILGSEILVRLLLSLIQTALMVGIGLALFGVHLVGNPFAVVGVVLLGATTFVSLGYMLASFSRTVDSAQGLIQFIQFPMMFLSGVFFSTSMMPNFLRPIIKAMPLTYLADALRQVMVGMAPEYALSLDLGILGAWMLVTMVLAVIFWRWE